MDPNANLQEQEDLLTRPLADSPVTRYADRARLAELREALSDWLRGGGFAPDWSVAPNARIYFAGLTQRRPEPARPPAPAVCSCTHSRLYHASWGNCLVEGCGCEGFTWAGAR